MRQVAVLGSPEDGGLQLYGQYIIFLSSLCQWFLTAPLLSAINMLALITEKLQKQSLDESTASNSTNIKNSISDEDTLNQNTSSTNSLSVKGNNVWTLSIDTSNHSYSKQDGGKRGNRGNKGNKTTNQNTTCDTSPSTPNAPPSKKHCRSLSVPPDQSASSWQPILHKPIPVMFHDFHLHSTKFSAQGHVKDLSGTRSNFNKSFISSASPVSVDSGHVTSSDFQTPPGSPIPRPASAMSENAHNSFWFDYSPYKFNRFEILQNRSLSCEDRISSGPLHGVSSHGLDSLHHTSPPRIHRIPRCKSQPCVLHDRKCGKKRRHDYDRPTLDFTKMTQTAYPSGGMTKPIPFSPSNNQKRSHRDEPDSVVRLVPIASSPLDTDIPFKGLENFPTSPIDDLPDVSKSPKIHRNFSSCHFQEPGEYLVDSGLDYCDYQDAADEDDQEILFPLKDLDMDEIEKH